MRPMGFINRLEKEYGISKDIDFTHSQHKLITGSSGCGKTTELIRQMTDSMVQSHGLILIDEKGVLHNQLKAIKHKMPEIEGNIYQLGSPAYGRTDIRLNILAFCSSRKQAKSFFNKLVSDDYTKTNISSHSFWARGASKMGYDSWVFISTIQKLLASIQRSQFNSENRVNFTHEYKISIKNDKTKLSTFKLSSDPLTFTELNHFFTDYDSFRVISEGSQELVEAIEFKMLQDIDISTISEKEAREIDKLIKELMSAEKNIHKYKLHVNKAEASGDTGIWFTLQSSIPDGLIENKMINEPFPTHDIIELLEDGHIVIVDSEILENIVVATLLNVLWDILSLRSGKHHARHISCVVEEASRVLTPDTGLERVLAYARQSNLFLSLVLQSTYQLENIFGKSETEAILTNLQHYRFSSKEDPLPKFNFRIDNDDEIHSFAPDFISSEELYEAELAFQGENGQYGVMDRSDREIVKYDQRLYEMKEVVTLIDIDTMEHREIAYDIEEDKEQGTFLKKYRQEQITKEIDGSQYFSSFEDEDSPYQEEDLDYEDELYDAMFDDESSNPSLYSEIDEIDIEKSIQEQLDKTERGE